MFNKYEVCIKIVKFNVLIFILLFVYEIKNLFDNINGCKMQITY